MKRLRIITGIGSILCTVILWVLIVVSCEYFYDNNVLYLVVIIALFMSYASIVISSRDKDIHNVLTKIQDTLEKF